MDNPAAVAESPADEEETPEAEPVEDVRPKRAHTLFRKPMKKDE